MAQHDYIISNQTFPNTRADINNLASAIATNNSGTSAPTTQYAGQFWIDTTTTTWTLYIHDGTDDIQFATIDTSANTVNFTDSALSVQTDPNPALGGDLDLNSNDITGTGNINITGTATVNGEVSISEKISHIGDTNTFLQFNGNDTFSITTAGTERMRFQSGGSVGIGESTPVGILTVNGGTNTNVFFQTTGSGNTATDGMVVGNVGGDSSSYQFYNYESGYMRFATNGSEAMRIDSSGRVGIGTSSPDRELTVGGVSNARIGILSNDNVVGASQLQFGDSDNSQIGRIMYEHDANKMTFWTNNTEAMRIDSSGNVLSNTTQILPYVTNVEGISLASGSYGGLLCASRDGGTPLELNRKTSDGAIIQFRKDGTAKGSIDVNSSGIAIRLGGTADANALDDYEEGVHQVSITGSSGGSATVGDNATRLKYIKIGKEVWVHGEIHITGISSISGTVRVSLPFAVADTSDLAERGVGNCALRYIDVSTGVVQITPFCYSGQSFFTFKEMYDNSSWGEIAGSALSSGDEFVVSLQYTTS